MEASPTRSSPTRSAPPRPASRAWACRTRTQSAPTARSSALGPTAWSSTTTTAARPGHRRRQDRPARPRRLGAGRLLQGPREVREDLPRDRRRPVLGARRLRPDRGGRQGHAARSRLQLRQHRRREGLPRGGRDGDQGPPGRLRLLVVGIPDEKYGQAVAAVVAAARRRRRSSSTSCVTFLRDHLSGYKLPRSLTIVDEVPRNATGKAQYPAAKEMAPFAEGTDRLMRTRSVTSSGSSTRSSRSPRPSTSRPRSRGPAGSACSAASASTTPRSSSGS